MKNSLLVHKHLIIRAEAIRPPVDEEQLKNWLIEFIESINMKIIMGPYVKYCNMPGNRGITAVAIIETSHIAMHIWDEPHPALMQFDVYSCGEFNHTDICKKIMEDFDIHKIEYKYNGGIITIYNIFCAISFINNDNTNIKMINKNIVNNINF